MKTGDRVEFGAGTPGPHGGDRLGEIQRPERRHRRNGYWWIIPLSGVLGDGFLPCWYPGGHDEAVAAGAVGLRCRAQLMVTPSYLAAVRQVLERCGHVPPQTPKSRIPAIVKLRGKADTNGNDLHSL